MKIHAALQSYPFSSSPYKEYLTVCMHSCCNLPLLAEEGRGGGGGEGRQGQIGEQIHPKKIT